MDDIVIGKCVECHEKFETTKGEIEWLLEKGLKPYKRCKACRIKRREEKNNKDDSNKVSFLLKTINIPSIDRREKERDESSEETFKDL